MLLVSSSLLRISKLVRALRGTFATKTLSVYFWKVRGPPKSLEKKASKSLEKGSKSLEKGGLSYDTQVY
jgi:hypothetical protein